MAHYPAKEDRISILVATDNHIGYKYDDRERGKDALNTFEEILINAVKLKVDFILLGGDLFHENNPPRKVLYDVASLLKKYCFGDNPIQIRTMATGAGGEKPFNYMDPNINIAMPVFSVHGNHDDPVGRGHLAPLDLLEATSSINYFGKQKSVEDITISPILLEKGNTKLALYGLGSIKDDRLFRTFEAQKVKFEIAADFKDNAFNLFVLHQNRVRHAAKNYIPENVIPPFLDLVVWGHEHECMKDPVLGGNDQKTYIYQPGSSVITSLCEAETIPKNVGLLEIAIHPGDVKPKFSLTPIPLKTVRPLRLKMIDLNEMNIPQRDSKAVERVLVEEVTAMIAQNRIDVEEEAGNERPNPIKFKPLIRLKVKHSSEFSPINIPRFGQSFDDTVANPQNILSFQRVKNKSEMSKVVLDAQDTNVETETIMAKKSVLDLLEDEMKAREEQIRDGSTDGKEPAVAIRTAVMVNAIREFVEKDSRDAIKETIDYCKQEYSKACKNNLQEANVEDFSKYRRTTYDDDENEFSDVPTGTSSARGCTSTRGASKRARGRSGTPRAGVDRISAKQSKLPNIAAPAGNKRKAADPLEPRSKLKRAAANTPRNPEYDVNDPVDVDDDMSDYDDPSYEAHRSVNGGSTVIDIVDSSDEAPMPMQKKRVPPNSRVNGVTGKKGKGRPLPNIF
eukprot:CFRG4857T1